MSSTQNVTKDMRQDLMNYVLNRYKSLPAFNSGNITEKKTSPVKEESLSPSKAKHATMDIYRPPSLRSGDGQNTKTKLNVHAKEFVMNNSNSKSDDNSEISISSKEGELMTDIESDRSYSLNLSKSSGCVFNVTKSSSIPVKANDSQKFLPNLSHNLHDLQRAKSSGNVLSENSNDVNDLKMHFKSPFTVKDDNKMLGKLSPTKKSLFTPGSKQQPGNLKRSKSLNVDDALKLIALEASLAAYGRTFTEYELFPEKLRGLIRQAVENTDQMEDKKKIVLGRSVVEYILNDKKLASPASKLSIIIMDKDTTGAYLDSLLNTCQMLYQMKEKNALRESAKFVAFLTFLQELYTELKRGNLQLKLLSNLLTPPKMTFLILIARCCEDILMQGETHCITEVECLFHTLTTVGRDIEVEIPSMFHELFDIIREVLLKCQNGPEVQKILLQLIELRAANWQLPISALNYYYTKNCA